MGSNICSYCGEDAVLIEEQEIELSEPYSGTSKVKIKERVCRRCGFAEDDVGNDTVILQELSFLKKVSMVKMIESLNSMGLTTASMERSLELPARTLARWKNEETISPSAAGIALMRIIRTYPWILAVADRQFDPVIARTILLNQAARELMKISNEHPDYEMSYGARVSGTNFELFIRSSRKLNPIVVSGGSNVFSF